MLQPSTPILDVAIWVAASSLKGTVLIGAVGLLRYLLVPATASPWRHALWFPVLACMMCPLGPSIPFTTALGSGSPTQIAALWHVKPRTGAIQTDTFGTLDRQLNGGEAFASSQPPSPNSTLPALVRATRGAELMRLVPWLALLWAAGAAMLASIYARNLLKFRRIALTARTVEGSAGSVFERCAAELRVRRPVRLRETSEIDSPTVFGWWLPTLLLPLALHERLDDTQLRHVFLHELAHVKRNDVLINWVAALVQLLHWFNPFVWIAIRLMRSDMESACDARVLRHLSRAERGEYGNMLLCLADSEGGEIPSPYPLGIADSYTDLRRRLMMIARFRPTSAPIKLVAGLALAFLTSLAFIQPGFTSPSKDAASPRATQNGVKSATSRPPDGGVPMRLLIEDVAANIHKRLIVDPKVASTVILYGQRLDQITYPDFLTILRINGYTAIEVNGYINVVPLAEVRTWPLPTFTNDHALPDDQFANMSVDLKNACAPYLIPILRPLLPQYAHLAADMSSNTIIAVDTYANLKRVRSIIAQLDARTRPGTRCGASAK